MAHVLIFRASHNIRSLRRGAPFHTGVFLHFEEGREILEETNGIPPLRFCSLPHTHALGVLHHWGISVTSGKLSSSSFEISLPHVR